MVRCGTKNGYQNDMFLKEIIYYVITILHSIVNIIEGDICDHSMSTRIFTLTMIKIFIYKLYVR